MRKIILSILIFLLTSQGWCQSGAVLSGAEVVGAGVSAGACGITLSELGTTGLTYVGNIDAYQYIASKITGNGDTFKTLYLSICKRGTPTAAMAIKICPDASGSPTTVGCVNADTGITASSVCNDPAYDHVNFTTGITLTNAATYWIVYYSATNNGNDYLLFGNASAGQIVNSTTGVDESWSNVGGYMSGFKLSTCLD